ncbi:hypothetical protein AALD74_09555 [Lachnospiraceae bacterium 48-21]
MCIEIDCHTAVPLAHPPQEPANVLISPYVASDPFAQAMVDYIADEKTSAWHWLDLKEGYAMNCTGQVFADYAAGSLDTEGFVNT